MDINQNPLLTLICPFEGSQAREMLEKAEAKGTSKGNQGVPPIPLQEEAIMSIVNNLGVPTKGKEMENKKPQKDLRPEKHTEPNVGKLVSISSNLSISSNTLIYPIDYVFNCDACKGIQEKEDLAAEEIIVVTEGETMPTFEEAIEGPCADGPSSFPPSSLPFLHSGKDDMETNEQHSAPQDPPPLVT
ncbi:uncharacterized protein G2W53_026587 [Senna tora]|uniref:Uncharacterized protein n=1 Tax=Senna tora TaxID=362788 RepID=A0A834TH92_9FABA|nr:uncharacterized protein G2W53_026587 [Senna tora]